MTIKWHYILHHFIIKQSNTYSLWHTVLLKHAHHGPTRVYKYLGHSTCKYRNNLFLYYFNWHTFIVTSIIGPLNVKISWFLKYIKQILSLLSEVCLHEMGESKTKINCLLYLIVKAIIGILVFNCSKKHRSYLMRTIYNYMY